MNDSIKKIVKEWRPVVGYEDIYSISSIGNVRRDAKGSGAFPGKILNHCLHKGYPQVVLSKNSIKKAHPIHRLVCHAFIGDRPAGKEIHHKDGNKQNNVVSNLEYVDHIFNMRHAFTNGFRKPVRGEDHTSAKLTNKEAEKVRKWFLDKKYTVKFMAIKYNVNIQTLYGIIRGRTYQKYE